jgi:hypothetical protein
MSIIKAGMTVPTGFVVTSDDTGNLEIKTGPSEVTALAIDGNQKITINGVDKLSIPGGLTGQVLSTDGSGTLSWIDGAPGTGDSSTTVYRFKYTATAGQTIFSGEDDNGAELGGITTTELQPNNHIVFLNGSAINEYTFNQSQLTLTTAAKVGDELLIIIFSSFRVPDAVPASTGGTFKGSVTVRGSVNALNDISAGGKISGDGSGLTGLTASQIQTALGFTPYNGTANPNSFVSANISMNGPAITTALGYTPYPTTNNQFYLSKPSQAIDIDRNTTPLADTHIQEALGYTPYDADVNSKQFVNSTQLTTAVSGLSATISVPSGTICMWWGSTSAIPDSWALCDGTNGTPDMRDTFPMGAGGSMAPVGGSNDAVVVSHTHTAETDPTFTGAAMAAHDHSITDPTHTHSGVVTSAPLNNGSLQISEVTGTGNFTVGQSAAATTTIDIGTASAGTPTGTVASNTITSAGVSGTGKNMPKYQAIHFIMKL